MFEPHGLELEFDRETVVFEHPGAEDLATFYEQNFGPLVKAREADEGLSIDAAYLVTVGQKPG